MSLKTRRRTKRVRNALRRNRFVVYLDHVGNTRFVRWFALDEAFAPRADFTVERIYAGGKIVSTRVLPQ